MIKLTGVYFANIKKTNNHYLQQYNMYSENDCIERALTGYLLPQSFMYFDSIGYITTPTNIPLLYHTPRHSSNKTITISLPPNEISLKYSTVLPSYDIKNNYKNSDK